MALWPGSSPPHVEFMLIGWTVQLTMGVAFWILPRFEGGVSRGAVGYAWFAFVLLNAERAAGRGGERCVDDRRRTHRRARR